MHHPRLRRFLLHLVYSFVAFALFGGGWWIGLSGQTPTQLWQSFSSGEQLISPFVAQEPLKPLPLLQYSISSLQQRTFSPRELNIERVLREETDFTSFVFSYQTLGGKMTGQMNVPRSLLERTGSVATPLARVPVIILVRGYVPLELYTHGVGTKNAAAAFAQQGYVTLAPDFLGYGESDPDLTDTWEARFIKPAQVVELLRTVQTRALSLPLPHEVKSIPLGPVGIWAHSNGGQIALAALEITQEPIPATLWAPVTAPFPYSILYFGDELEDEGKEQRAWIALFERDYDVFDFTVTKHVDALTGPLQIHHGSADDSALKAWSDDFVARIRAENERRKKVQEERLKSTTSAELSQEVILPPIDLGYFVYPGADHNLQPVWSQAMERDIAFFAKHL